MSSQLSKRVREALVKKHSCYVLITCGEPNEDGEMQVEMSYEGDAVLAAFLIEGAQATIESQIE